MHHENTNLLNEVSKASKMGIDAIHILLPKIKQEELKKQLKDHAQNIKNYRQKPMKQWLNIMLHQVKKK